MDISEQTISQESFGLSPETEQKMNLTVASDSNGFLVNEAASKLIGRDKTTTSTTTTTTVSDHKMATQKNSSINNKITRTSNKNYTNTADDNKFDDSSLDNRILVNKNTVMNSTKQRIGMTLVDMHPLMLKSDDEDLSPDSSFTFDGGFNLETEFTNTEYESPMHVSPIQQRFDTLHLPKAQDLNDKSYISSGDSEPDISQYQASVEPTFQSVTLTNFNIGKLTENNVPRTSSGLRKIPLTAELMVTKEDDSSVETISNNSFDDDIEDEDGLSFKETKSNRQPASNQNVVLTSVSATIANDNLPKIQQNSTAVTLANGQTRDIDMKVIEPYKRCLSHGGYIKSPGHNAIVIFSACYLPDRSRADYHYVMENLFL